MPRRLLFGAPTARLSSAKPSPSSERVSASSAAMTRAEERPDEPSAGSAGSAAVRDVADRGNLPPEAFATAAQKSTGGKYAGSSARRNGPQTPSAATATLFDRFAGGRNGHDARTRRSPRHAAGGPHRRCRIPAAGRPCAAGPGLSTGRNRPVSGGGAGAWRRLGQQGPHRQRLYLEAFGRERDSRRLPRFPDAARGALSGLARRHQSRGALAEGAGPHLWQPAGLGRG